MAKGGIILFKNENGRRNKNPAERVDKLRNASFFAWLAEIENQICQKTRTLRILHCFLFLTPFLRYDGWENISNDNNAGP
jgi:hypothetical protein